MRLADIDCLQFSDTGRSQEGAQACDLKTTQFAAIQNRFFNQIQMRMSVRKTQLDDRRTSPASRLPGNQISETVASQVDHQHRYQDGQPGEDHDMRRGLHIGLSVKQHRPPFGCGGLHAKAQKTET